MKRKNIFRILAVTALVVLIPLVAMQFSDDVDWNIFDFLAAGVLLFGTGLVYEFGVKRIRTPKARTVASIVLLAALALVWAELAVGVFGSPFAGS
jgi:peptidoglycan/LPS O-acetylase OafA/YrhL